MAGCCWKEEEVGCGVCQPGVLGVRQGRVEGRMRDFGVLKPEKENVELQSRLESQFASFFEGVVSEWNPCYDEGGRLRYRWDDDLGVHDVEIDDGMGVDMMGQLE